MASKRTLAQRLFNAARISSQACRNCRISSFQSHIPPDPNKCKIAPDPGDNVLLSRFRQGVSLPPLRTAESLFEKLKSFGVGGPRIRLEGLNQPAATSLDSIPSRVDFGEGVSVDTRKLLRAVELETMKSKLRAIERSWIPYSEFVRICGEGCLDPEQGIRYAEMLDESGAVIILKNMVFLRPEQVAKAIEALIPHQEANPNDPRRKELEEMEKQKAAIDAEAETLVRQELCYGLAFLVVQTGAFMRLTFWELSWDVMEPICFYVTSMYFMAGYAFFLRTNREPSFEGFFQSRFSAKQQRLMKLHNFDIERYNDLRKAFGSCLKSKSNQDFSNSLMIDSEKTKFGALHS